MKTYRISKIGLKVQLFLSGIYSTFIFFCGFTIIISVFQHAWSVILASLLMLLFSLTFPFLGWLTQNAITITIDSKKFVKEFKLLIRRTSTLEAHQIEGVDIRQGIFARKYNYGILTITGAGGKKISTTFLDSPEEVAKEIRKINPKLS